MSTNELTALAQKNLVTSLEKFGNVLSIPHRKALYAMLDGFSRMAAGALHGRYAWGLAPGHGKSRAVIEWAKAVYITKASYSMIVCASRLDQLCTMKQDMMDAGIPETSIGLIYHGPQITKERALSFPCTTDNDDRPFLLATHARVKASPGNMQQYHYFHGEPRSLMVWDESLLVSKTELFDAKKLIKQLGSWINVLKVTEGDHTDLHNWLTEWDTTITAQFLGFVFEGFNTLPAQSFTLTYDQKELYGEWFRKDDDDVLEDFLNVCDQPMRLLRNGKEVVVSYSVVVPSELKNIMVLDASYAIRKLEKADKTIINAETLPACTQFGISFHSLKRYDHAEVYRMAHPGGRNSMVDNTKQMRTILKDVVKLIADLPSDEGVLVFLYKERHGKDVQKELVKTLTTSSIDIKATLPTGQPRLNVLTWGQETSLNCFSFCANVILVGILHRNRSELETANIGQLDDIRYRASSAELDALSLSERTHLAFQALSRGASRTTLADSQAAPSKTFIIEREEELETELAKVMPGCLFKTWIPTYSDPESHGSLIKGLKGRILSTLRGALEDELTCRSFKGRVMGGSRVEPRAWKRAMKEALAELPQWKQLDQRLLRAA